MWELNVAISIAKPKWDIAVQDAQTFCFKSISMSCVSQFLNEGLRLMWLLKISNAPRDSVSRPQ